MWYLWPLPQTLLLSPLYFIFDVLLSVGHTTLGPKAAVAILLYLCVYTEVEE